MSDDERFDLEYGDFGDSNHGSNGDAGNLDGEETSLLGNNRPYNDYGNSAG